MTLAAYPYTGADDNDDDIDDVHDAEGNGGLSQANYVSPQETAIAKVLNLYAPQPDCNVPYAERRREALAAVMQQVAGAGRELQASYMRALRVDQLLAEGKISEPTRPRQFDVQPADAPSSALAIYTDRVKADSRLTARLLRRAGESLAPTADQSFEAYLSSLISADFAKGFDGCEYPQLFNEANFDAERLSGERSNGYLPDGDTSHLVDESWELERQTKLIGQALEIAYQAEERFLGLGDAPSLAPIAALGSAPTSEDDAINPHALALSLGDAEQSERSDDYSRPRP